MLTETESFRFDSQAGQVYESTADGYRELCTYHQCHIVISDSTATKIRKVLAWEIGTFFGGEPVLVFDNAFSGTAPE